MKTQILLYGCLVAVMALAGCDRQDASPDRGGGGIGADSTQSKEATGTNSAGGSDKASK